MILSIISFRLIPRTSKNIEKWQSVLLPERVCGKEDYCDLINWIKNDKTGLYIIPPNDEIFSTFRYLTHKGVYGSLGEVNQLAYSPNHYFELVERLKKLGLESSKPHHHFFNMKNCDYLHDVKKFGAKVISSKTFAYRCTDQLKIFYKNSSYQVLGL